MSQAESQEVRQTVMEQEGQTQIIVPDKMLQEVISDVFGGLGGPELHNFDGTTQDKWRLTALATGPETKSADDCVGQIINVRYFFVHPVEISGNTPGEFSRALRSVLITPDHDCYAFVSNVLARDLARMVRTFGLRPWEPPIAVQVVKSKAKVGHFYSLCPAT